MIDSNHGDTRARRCVLFHGDAIVAAGDVGAVAVAAKDFIDASDALPTLCFDEVTSEPIDLDLHGSREEVVTRYAHTTANTPSTASAPNALQLPPEGATETNTRGPGRPKLGVVAREVTLLPRHWGWLATQPGGASVALRRLVEDARRRSAASDARRLARESTYRFMVAMAGDRAGFEEATRALYAAQADRFGEMVREWPNDVRDHVLRLAAPALLPLAE